MLDIEGSPVPSGGLAAAAHTAAAPVTAAVAPETTATQAAGARTTGTARATAAARAAGTARATAAARAAGTARATAAARAAGTARATAAYRAAALAWAAMAACVLLVGGTALAGCAQKAAAAPSLQLANAFVEVPSSEGSTAAYLVIQNRGPADRLTSARTSVGGRVIFRAPARSGGTEMKTVPDILIPADSLVRLTPDGSHLLITGAGPMKGGTQITLTLVFAEGGTMSVAADVTNPASGGSSYFLN
jgi:copper(I)-binding protein